VPVIPLPGGLQPRAAVAYMTVAALEVGALCGVGPELRSEVDVAAAQMEDLVERWGPGGAEDAQPKTVARALDGTIATIVGAGPTIPVAYRWKTQHNENAKVPAYSHELPEADHNEIVGWDGAAALGPFSAVFLNDTDLHPRERRRIALTRELIAPAAKETFVLEGEGETTLARIFSLVLLGDLVSVYRAVLRGIDPGPVAVIEELKARMASAD